MTERHPSNVAVTRAIRLKAALHTYNIRSISHPTALASYVGMRLAHTTLA